MDEKTELCEEEIAGSAEGTEATEEIPAKKTDSKKIARELLEAQKKLADAEARLTAAEAAAAEAADKHLRLAAEYDHFRRRATAERSAAYTDGLEGALEKLLPIFDNLERAALYNEADKVAEGLVLIAKSASEALAALSVETFGEVGDAFDPNLHNAVMHVEDDSLGEGVISAVHQKGYKKGERILRYAMVTVAN